MSDFNSHHQYKTGLDGVIEDIKIIVENQPTSQPAYKVSTA